MEELVKKRVLLLNARHLNWTNEKGQVVDMVKFQYCADKSDAENELGYDDVMYTSKTNVKMSVIKPFIRKVCDVEFSTRPTQDHKGFEYRIEKINGIAI